MLPLAPNASKSAGAHFKTPALENPLHTGKITMIRLFTEVRSTPWKAMACSTCASSSGSIILFIAQPGNERSLQGGRFGHRVGINAARSSTCPEVLISWFCHPSFSVSPPGLNRENPNCSSYRRPSCQ
mmetsp:Transcript_46573/g.86520  ORF Transcript_46573/g.86520 Transcript_46573/m.86520 type:complete len:128 (+) Transcript_46573:317-700(+)